MKTIMKISWVFMVIGKLQFKIYTNANGNFETNFLGHGNEFRFLQSATKTTSKSDECTQL